jgi:hypothetical protein
MLHVSAIRPSSGRNIFARAYSADKGSVVFRLELDLDYGILFHLDPGAPAVWLVIAIQA